MRKNISGYIAWDKELSNENRGGLEGKGLPKKPKMEAVSRKMWRDKN